MRAMGEEVSGINGGRRWLNRLHKDRIRAMNTELREVGGLKQRGNKEDEKEEKEQFFFSAGVQRRMATNKTSTSNIHTQCFVGVAALNLTVGLIQCQSG